MGSGSDYSSFIQHEGIPSLNLGYGGEDQGGEYHSIYDSYSLYEKFKDPGFQYGVALAETAGHAVLRMSDADELPFDFTHLFKTIDEYSKELITLIRPAVKLRNWKISIINSGGYTVGEDPTKNYILPQLNPMCHILIFHHLQNALLAIRKQRGQTEYCFSEKYKGKQDKYCF